MLVFAFLLLLVGIVKCSYYGNLLSNSGLEEDTFTSPKGWNNWNLDASGSKVSLSTDCHTGSYSAQVTDRKNTWSGLGQDVVLDEGKNYAFTAYIKLLNTPSGQATAEVDIMIQYQNTTNGYTTYSKEGTTRFMQPLIWQRVGADFTVVSGYDAIRLYILVTNREVNYLLDTTDLRELTPLPWNWAQKADREIDRIRKGDIHFMAASGYPEGITLKVHQETSLFAFGGATDSIKMLDSKNKEYQEFFYDNFEWATLFNDLQWVENEPKEGSLNYYNVLEVLDALDAYGIKVFGESLFSGDMKRSPLWVKDVENEALVEVMKDRVNDIMALIGDRIGSWDANYANLHSQLFEQRTGEVNLTMDILRWVKAKNPNLYLFLNDYDVLSRGYMTQAYRSQGQRYKDTPFLSLYGLGIKGHFNPSVDLTLIKYRLDELAAAGLPLFITEFCVDTSDKDEQAAILDDVMRLFFSHPSVEGFIYGCVSDIDSLAPNASLAIGPSAEPNAAGLRWRKLMKKEWRTDSTLPLQTGTTTIRGFKGNYSLSVIKDGLVIHERKFTLKSERVHVNLYL